MKPVAIWGMLTACAFLLLLSACAYPTPRYEMFKGVELPEDEIALLQIPGHIDILFVDNKRPRAGVRDDALATLIAGHLYRETTFAAGPHSMEFTIMTGGGYSRRPFVTAFRAKAGHTYRIQTKGVSNRVCAWVEELPEMLQPLQVRVLLARHERQRREWNNHRWRRIAAGLVKGSSSWTLSLEETISEAARCLTQLDQIPSY